MFYYLKSKETIFKRRQFTRFNGDIEPEKCFIRPDHGIYQYADGHGYFREVWYGINGTCHGASIYLTEDFGLIRDLQKAIMKQTGEEFDIHATDGCSIWTLPMDFFDNT